MVAEDVEHRQFCRLAAQVVEEKADGGRVADIAGEDEDVEFGKIADGAEAAFGVQVAVDADIHVCSLVVGVRTGGF